MTRPSTGGGVDLDLEGVTEPTDHLAARGVGDGFDGEGAGGWHSNSEILAVDALG